MERSIIEVAPLAYMRGRTLDDSFIIWMKLKIQPEKIKMFLTRLDLVPKLVTGDITQIDLPKKLTLDYCCTKNFKRFSWY